MGKGGGAREREKERDRTGRKETKRKRSLIHTVQWETFEGESLHEFCNFSAIRESFSTKY